VSFFVGLLAEVLLAEKVEVSLPEKVLALWAAVKMEVSLAEKVLALWEPK
jgi:hypothetical protein